MYIVKQHSGTGDVGLMIADRGDGIPGIVAEVFSAVAHKDEREDARALALAAKFALVEELLSCLEEVETTWASGAPINYQRIVRIIALAKGDM